MKYLYGDATESPLDKNYIELLRDVIDFGVSVMLAHDNITRHKKTAAERQIAAKTEHEQLESLSRIVDQALELCRTRTNAPAATRCIDSIKGASLAEVRRAEGGVTAALGAEVAKIHEAIEREQANNVKRLEGLLLRHDLPGCSLWVNARLSQSGGYVAELIGKASSEVAFVIDLEIPQGHILSELMRVERIAPGLTLKVPEESGWVRKSVKMRAHKLAKEYVVAVSRSTKRATVKLRSNIQEPDSGYDLIFGTKSRVAVARIAKGQEVEPFEPDSQDRTELLAFYEELSRSLGGLKDSRRSLRGAQLDGTPLAEHPDATVLVQRLVAQLAPIVQEISRHSLSPTELVLKRVLADDRREEIFTSKADLRAKIDPLPENLRRVFDPLGLADARSGLSAPPPAVALTPTPLIATSRPAETSVEIPHPREDFKPRAAASQPPAAPTSQPSPALSAQVPASQPSTPSQAPPAAKPTATPTPSLADIPAKDTSRSVPPPSSEPISDDATAVRGQDRELPLPLTAANIIPSNPELPEPTPPPARSRPPTADPGAAARSDAKGRTLRPSSARSLGTPPPPPSSGAGLPKPSAPPPRPAPRGAGAPPPLPSDPGKNNPARPGEVQSSDSVDVQLDELLNND